MIINIPTSIGELVDKISILIVKQKNITDQDKLSQVNKELNFLQDTLSNHLTNEEIDIYLNNLVDVNSRLWIIEDNIRECERKKSFNQEFIKLARSVYITNDERAKIKLEMNNHTGSKIKEIKEYTSY